MPQAKNNKRMNNTNKKRRGAASNRQLAAVTVPTSHLGAAFPISMRSRLRYVLINTITGGAAGSYAGQVIRTNSVYDPDFTGVGSQPAGFAALATLYGFYRVVGAKIKWRVCNDSGGSVNVSVFQSASSGLPASYQAASQTAGAQNYLLSDQSGGKNNVTIVKNIQPWIVLGITRDRYMNDDQYAAAVTANPATASFLTLYLGALTVSGSAQYILEIVYDVVFFSRLALA